MERLLAFVDVLTDPSRIHEISGQLAGLPNVEELYETSEFIVSLVSGANVEEIREFLNGKVRKMPGVRSAVTYFVLDSRLDIRNGSGHTGRE